MGGLFDEMAIQLVRREESPWLRPAARKDAALAENVPRDGKALARVVRFFLLVVQPEVAAPEEAGGLHLDVQEASAILWARPPRHVLATLTTTTTTKTKTTTAAAGTGGQFWDEVQAGIGAAVFGSESAPVRAGQGNKRSSTQAAVVCTRPRISLQPTSIGSKKNAHHPSFSGGVADVGRCPQTENDERNDSYDQKGWPLLP